MEHRKLTGGYVDPSATPSATTGQRGQRGNLAALAHSYFVNHIEPVADRCRSMGCAGVRSSRGSEAAPGPAHDPTDSAVPLVDARCVGCRRPHRHEPSPRRRTAPRHCQADRASRRRGHRRVPRSGSRVVPRRLRPWARCRPASVRSRRPDRRPRRLPPASAHHRPSARLAAGGGADLGPPKTQRSFRTIPLADAVVASWPGTSSSTEPGGMGCCCTGRMASRCAVSDSARRGVSSARRPSCPRRDFTTVRHTYASTLLSGGVSVAATADYLGHSPAELLRTYALLMPRTTTAHARRCRRPSRFSMRCVPSVSRPQQNGPRQPL